ncbi:MAG: 16S rRNA (adenine(1518)-N(6)/adenine(1519)-N(6))-dimethyltransferase RsmA [Candidatus Omnitrophica bacterium]|nr:16S rRNA (adenine(1518)-N(6)/adenine(1519)-N(6))-dimethyltransferase RsmA [Candidatus Omnitrophota bacterium]
MLSLSELTKIFHSYNLSPKKILGQHFLIDKNIQKKIIASCQITDEDIVLEIGPGLGALTEEICKEAKFVYAVEKDSVLSALLKERLKSFKNLKIINSDILNFPLPIKDCSAKLKLIGNLPYYLSTAFLKYLIENRKYINSVYISLQKEFAQRIIAKPGKKDYGALTIFINVYANAEILFPIKKTCFYPPPKVDSCFMKFEMLTQPKVEEKERENFFEIVRFVFQKRRKTVLNSLLGKFPDKEKIKEILERLNIDSWRRPETLSMDDFLSLTKFFKIIAQK